LSQRKERKTKAKSRSRKEAGRAYLLGVRRVLREDSELRALFCEAVEARNRLCSAAKSFVESAQAYAGAVDSLCKNGEAARPSLRPTRQRLLDVLATEHETAAAFLLAADAFEKELVRVCRRDNTAMRRFHPLLQAPVVLPGSPENELCLRFPRLSECVRVGRGSDPLGDAYLRRMWPEHVRAQLGGFSAPFSRTAEVAVRLSFPGPQRARDPDNYLGVELLLHCLILAGVLPDDWLGAVSCELGEVSGLPPRDGVVTVREVLPRFEPEISDYWWATSGGEPEELEGQLRPVALAPVPGVLAVRFPPAVPRAPLVRNWCRQVYRYSVLAGLWGASLRGLVGSGLRGGFEWPDLPVQPADVTVFLPAQSWRAGALSTLRCKLVMNALVLAGLLRGDTFGNARLRVEFRPGLKRLLAFVAPANRS